MDRTMMGRSVRTDRTLLSKKGVAYGLDSSCHAGLSPPSNGAHKQRSKRKSHSVLVLLCLLCILYSFMIMRSTNLAKLESWPTTGVLDNALHIGLPRTDQGAANRRKPQLRRDAPDFQANQESTTRRQTSVTPEGSQEQTGQQYQLVFSTGCSKSQDWQSYVFFYHALKVQQQGHVTRIVSGCTEEQKATLEAFHKRAIFTMSPNFHVHFTPDFSDTKQGVHYVYFNKPYGLKHWMEHGLRYPDDRQHDDDVVILLDPDQMLLRPFTNDFSNSTEVWKRTADDAREQRLPLKVEHGRPFAQMYGYIDQWKTHVNLTQVLTGDAEASPIYNVTKNQALDYYPAGPPYLATARDMHRISCVWSDFAVRVYDSYPHLLGEMFSYSLAAAHLNLPHRLARSFMLSSLDDPVAESWSELMNHVSDEEVCRDVPRDCLPHVLHYCQRYKMGHWQFDKHTWDGSLFSSSSCEAPLFEEPFSNITEYDYWTDGVSRFNLTGQGKHKGKNLERGHGFMICTVLQKMNEAAEYFKQTQCKDEITSFEKSYRQGRLT